MIALCFNMIDRKDRKQSHNKVICSPWTDLIRSAEFTKCEIWTVIYRNFSQTICDPAGPSQAMTELCFHMIDRRRFGG